jgi:23S rRNA (uracil1939-C5)-methyltransferase
MAAQPQAQSTDDQESAQAQRARLDRMAYLPKAPAHAPAGALVIESLDMDAQGIAHREDGKVVFVEGALPFEVVSANVNRKKNNWEQATLTAVYAESSQRVTPGCPHFGLHAGACGGCKMQHLHAGAQVAVKQRVLEDNLWHLGKVKAETMLRPIEGPAWGYRYRARLSVRHVRKKARYWWAFMSVKAATWPTCKPARCCPPMWTLCSCRCVHSLAAWRRWKPARKLSWRAATA